MPQTLAHRSAAALRNDLDTATAERPSRRFEALKTSCSDLGIDIVRTDPEDGPVHLLMFRQGALRLFACLEDAEAFLIRASQTFDQD